MENEFENIRPKKRAKKEKEEKKKSASCLTSLGMASAKKMRY